MPATLQNHIHLSSTLADVTTPASTSLWEIRQWSMVPRITMTLERTQTQNLKRWVAKDSAGNEVRQFDCQYKITVQPLGGEDVYARLLRLYAMNGRVVYLHDIYHDAAAHGSGCRTMVLQITEEPDLMDPLVQKIFVRVQLTDASL